MGDSLCDMFLKEHEKYLPVHGMIQASTAKPKTPYQLDLEVKDRKPSIIPKVGDRVKIKSWEWYEKWKDGRGYVNVPEHFTPTMSEFCGKVLTVEESQHGLFRMKEDKSKWYFSPEMFEEVYPVQEINPYLLDLEVKDRKPDIVPKVGDKVKIKSREWYKKWSKDNPLDSVDVLFGFADYMSDYCGHVMTVYKVLGDDFRLKEDSANLSFSLEMFEEVYPLQEQLSSKFPKIDLNSPYLHQSPYDVKGSELVLSKEELERLKEQIRIKWVVKPKLKQIKTIHLIKLKKL